MNFSRSRRMTRITVSRVSPANGLTGVITAVLISSSPDHFSVSAGRRRGRDDDRRQDLIQPVATDLEPRRKAQRRAELLRRLVHSETGAVGGDLEQHAARLAEVDRLEVPAVNDRRDVAAGGQQRTAPFLL